MSCTYAGGYGERPGTLVVVYVHHGRVRSNNKAGGGEDWPSYVKVITRPIAKNRIGTMFTYCKHDTWHGSGL